MDTYKTIAGPSEPILYKEKHSKFFGYAFPVQNEDEVKIHLEALRKEHPGAVHYCYAWQMGVKNVRYRANDDGEPSHTAGTPIYGQIQSFGLTNVLVVIVRFFGGIKLGASGLIAAYKLSAQLALEAAEIVEETVKVFFKVNFTYADMNKVMRIIKEKNLQVMDQQLELDCSITVSARALHADAVREAFDAVYGISVEELPSEAMS